MLARGNLLKKLKKLKKWIAHASHLAKGIVKSSIAMCTSNTFQTTKTP